MALAPSHPRVTMATNAVPVSVPCKAARGRWGILAQAIHRAASKLESTAEPELREGHEPGRASVRRFQSFGLITTSAASGPSTQPAVAVSKGFEWFLYEMISSISVAKIHLRHIVAPVSLQDMLGFNNTGNVCVWPSEEVLALHCVRHAAKYTGQAVCELGAGMTAMAGLFLAATVPVRRLWLTDGNDASASNIQVAPSHITEYPASCQDKFANDC